MPPAEKLVHLKQRLGLTTEEISLKTKIPVGTLNKIFAGQTKNPSLRTIGRLCAFFAVPVRYLLDDSIPVSYSISAHTEIEGTLMLSEREKDLFFQFRQLDEYSRRLLESLLKHLLLQSFPCRPNHLERCLLCYLPIGMGRVGVFADSFHFRSITAPLCAITREADYAIYILTNSLEPAYSPGTLLAVKRAEAEHNQLGLFMLNREALVRNLHLKRGVKKLISLNLSTKSIAIEAEDEFYCLGIILGAIRNYRWI